MNDLQLAPIPTDLPCAWGGPAGTGSIRVQPEDFQVTEIPLVTPDENGEHVWLYIRKRGTNTQWVARQLARHACAGLSRVSYAGLKDRHALTEQWFSVHLPGKPGPDWQALNNETLQVLDVRRHSRKLKRGTLLGNRFCITVRDVQADAGLMEQRLQAIQDGGMPNFFGSQRFGREGDNLRQAARLLNQPKSRLPQHKRSLYLSAVRSALFNRVLAARIEQRCWNTALPGEALQLAGKSACFVMQQPDHELQQRLERNEVHPTGPLCGEGPVLPTGEAADYEQSVLRPWNNWVQGLKQFRLAAARRALRVHPGDLSWKIDADGSCSMRFFLPAGSYATVLLREVLATREPK
jgi:tRNA pseudouridine13 synthase